MKLRNLVRLISFNGRANRAEFLRVSLGVLVVEALFVALLHALKPGALRDLGAPLYEGDLLIGGWLLSGVFIRRLHDLGRSGWLLPLGLLPAVVLEDLSSADWAGVWPAAIGVGLYAIAYLVLALRKGIEGPMRYDDRRLRKAARAAASKQLRERMREMALPTLLLKPTKGAVFSKLGGAPELPANAEWPAGHRGPRAFVAQLDLSEVRAGGGPEWLPSDGRLYCFAEQDGWDGPDSVRCLFTRDPPETRRMTSDGSPPTFNERRVTFRRHASLPSPDWLCVDEGKLDTEDLIELTDLPNEPFGEGPQHRIGGYPSEIQGGQLALECEFEVRRLKINYKDVPAEVAEGAKDWRLLLQVDSDDKLGMNWVDAGRLYIFVRERDALAGDFTKTATICQFY